MKLIIIFLVLVLVFIFYLFFRRQKIKLTDVTSFITNKKHSSPFRKLCDENRNIIPVMALTSFLWTPDDINTYNEYIANGVKVIGYTSYKTFPKVISDSTQDNQTMDVKFDYTGKIKNWVACFKNLEDYGFTDFNNILEMSESDFKDPEDFSPKEKKYDFIYSCLEDDKETCPLNAWNAVNRNFNLALKCFPIMVDEFNLKILVVGRLNCGLEKFKNIEVVNMLPYHEFQDRLKESKYLFVPNIYDASPRVITEAISKDIPVLMNRHIICGSKYINYNTGEFFTDEHDIRYHLKKLLDKKISPKKWWKENYSKSKSGVKFKNFLDKCYPGLINSKEVQFF